MKEKIQKYTDEHADYEQDGFTLGIQENISSGRIAEIYDFAEKHFQKAPADLPTDLKLGLLCAVMRISAQDIDEIIADHSEVSRTIKGHAFEVVFDTMMHTNGIVCTEVGGDSDVDRVINGFTLQLKTPYEAGCSTGIVSYKTHKTHGAKSQNESFNYYHKAEEFADFLVGLVSYHPFRVVIIDKQKLPRVQGHTEYILSPMFIPNNDPATINAYGNLGITGTLSFPENLLNLEDNECLPKSSGLLDMRSDYILRAIFIKDNFRIWDMNMRGFIREHVLTKTLKSHRIHVYPAKATGLDRSDKCDIVL